MIVAAQKKKENISEYLLYMYQVEDLIRANGFDLNRIDETIIQKFDVEYGMKREIREWYKGLIDRMQSQGIEKAGHMDFLRETAGELHELHLALMHDPGRQSYQDEFDRARPQLEALRMRSGHTGGHDVQLALNGLYGLLILRIRGDEVSEVTQKAFEPIIRWMRSLSFHYHGKS